jgi:N utilization substance protein B
MKRNEMREIALKKIFEMEFQNFSEEQLTNFLENQAVVNQKAVEYVRDVAIGVHEHSENLNEIINKNLKKEWKLERISKINIALLKLALYEMFYKDLPYKVVINEIVELSKSYGDDNSKTFVNGVLASVVKENFECTK